MEVFSKVLVGLATLFASQLHLVSLSRVEEGATIIGYYRSLEAYYTNFTATTWGAFTDVVLFALAVQNAQDGGSLGWPTVWENDNMNGYADRFIETAKDNGVRPLLGFGGPLGSYSFSYVVSSADMIKDMTRKIVGAAQSKDYAGICIGWEFPANDATGCSFQNDDDVTNLATLLEEIKAAWPEGRLVVRTSWSGFTNSKGQVSQEAVQRISNAVDVIDIMTYDAFTAVDSSEFSGPTSPLGTNCDTRHSQLGQSTSPSIEDTVDTLINQGADSSKFLVSVADYAREYGLKSEFDEQAGIHQQHNQKPASGYTDWLANGTDACGNKIPVQGKWLVNELITNAVLSSDSTAAGRMWTRVYDDCYAQPYVYSDRAERIYVYDDPQSITAKANYVLKKGLLGMSLYGLNGLPFESLKAMYDTLNGNTGSYKK